MRVALEHPSWACTVSRARLDSESATSKAAETAKAAKALNSLFMLCSPYGSEVCMPESIRCSHVVLVVFLGQSHDEKVGLRRGFGGDDKGSFPEQSWTTDL